MYTFRRISIAEFASHPLRTALPETTVFQTPNWLEFLRETQGGDPVVLLASDNGGLVGYFTGMIVSKLGIRILGSPFPGWSTSYMGFTLSEDANRREALLGLKSYVFDELRCDHLELMDRHITHRDIEGLSLDYVNESGYEVDLTATEDEIFARMAHPARTNIRKAQRSGLIVEEASDDRFVDEYFTQVCDVFGKQQLVPTFPIERVRSLVNHLSKSGYVTRLRTLKDDGSCVATAIMIGSGKQAYLWGAASYRSWQHLRPNELLYWTVMKRARELGRHRLDMVGEGDYKRKYGGDTYCIPWLRKSKYPLLGKLREMAQAAFNYRQKAIGRLRGKDERIDTEHGSEKSKAA